MSIRDPNTTKQGAEKEGKCLPVVQLYPGAEGGGCDEAGGEGGGDKAVGPATLTFLRHVCHVREHHAECHSEYAWQNQNNSNINGKTIVISMGEPRKINKKFKYFSTL